MALLVHRALARALPAVVGLLCAGEALAADPAFLPSAAPVNQPVEFGTGWYLRGDVGYESVTAPVITTDITTLARQLQNATGGLGVGYQFNEWFRADLSLDRSVYRQQGSGGSLYCPYGSVVNVDTTINGQPKTIQAYYYDPAEQCTPLINSHTNRTSLLLNGYFDLGNWWGITPYVGGGVGASYLQTTSSVNYYENANGQPWAPNLAQNGVYLLWCPRNVSGTFPPPSCSETLNLQFPFAQINPNSVQRQKKYAFAWDVTAGASYDISQNLKLDLHYRLLGVGSFTGLPGVLTGRGQTTKNLLSQEVRLGFRLLSD